MYGHFPQCVLISCVVGKFLVRPTRKPLLGFSWKCRLHILLEIRISWGLGQGNYQLPFRNSMEEDLMN